MQNRLHRLILILLALVFVAALSACVTLEKEARSPVETHDTPFGPMATFTSRSGFAVDYPADWEVAAERDQRCGRAKLCFGSPEGAILILQEGEIGGPGLGDITLPDYLDLMVADYERNEAGFEFGSREPMLTEGGVDAQVLSYTSDRGAVTARELWAAHDKDALNVSFLAWTENFAEIEELSQYVFNTVRPVSP